MLIFKIHFSGNLFVLNDSTARSISILEAATSGTRRIVHYQGWFRKLSWSLVESPAGIWCARSRSVSEIAYAKETTRCFMEPER